MLYDVHFEVILSVTADLEDPPGPVHESCEEQLELAVARELLDNTLPIPESDLTFKVPGIEVHSMSKLPRWEYTTRCYPQAQEGYILVTETQRMAEERLNAQGWKRVWADNTLEGAFVVYRRERQAYDPG